jgi:aminoglycoside 6-adenylyltransferase
MANTINESEVINKIKDWAESRPDIRAVLLTSSRARPDTKLDVFSDYDVILVAKDIRPYLEDESWMGDFGRVLVVYREHMQPESGFDRFIRVTQYEDGLKIDFTLWPVGLLKRAAAEPKPPGYLDDGYKVILDKDGLTVGMAAPTYQVFVPTVPTHAEYHTCVEYFFVNAPYVAKHIRRGDLFPLNSLLYIMRDERLRLLLEWRVEIDHNWSLKTGFYGKGLVKYLTPEIIRELESTYTRPGTEANWEVLFRLIELFRKVAREVGERLGYAYPMDIDNRVVKYVQKIKDMK